ncbi:hypothetical protein Q8A64_17480 [Oxalobacteraceae bacterium R-40]|uniref:Uncharacterized protein n=1 Tax=Keguizhuia sedimenti TaxID=3064264 RepID=A0ABU1BW24_9BURK|nr:hypothetical protein [Oxalobacteraceae bacterium R-40]
MTFRFRLLQEYEETYQTEEALVFSDTASPGLVPLWESIGVYESLYNSDGKQAREISKALAYGLDRLNNEVFISENLPVIHLDKVKEAIRFLENVLRACTVHSYARIETS